MLLFVLFALAAASKPEKVEKIQCDATQYCPDGETCCKLTSGQYGCCPAPKAVCCPDHIHCCPHGYRCDDAAGQCIKGLTTLPLMKKQPATVKALPQQPNNVKNIQCDATFSCSDNQTCCKLSTGDYGCCVHPQAVCCPDKIHCCPHGWKCNGILGKCWKDSTTMPLMKKEPATVNILPQEPKNVDKVQCDVTEYCPDNNTCCPMRSGKYGCCPIPEAYCCMDGKHCCPPYYDCDNVLAICYPSPSPLPVMEKEATMVTILPHKPEKVEKIQCDATQYCPDGETCCKLTSGQYGCCPAPKAVCCPDHIHCCPHGYRCDDAAGQCIKGLTTLPLMKKQPATVKALPQP